jgi:pimeloyl-ACP methyl ester carboxylesterase
VRLSVRGRKPEKTNSPVFKSADGEARFLAAYDAAMELWPIAYEARSVGTEFGSTHVIVSGPDDAPPLVMLHCALMTSAIWSPLVGELSRPYRTYAVDVIGDVGRTVPTNPPRTEEEMANWLAQVLDGLSIERAGLLAWSFGGWVGANFAMHYPQRVEKLALLAPFKPFTKQGWGFLFGFYPWLVKTPGAARAFEKKMCFKDDFGYPEHSALLYERFRSGKLALKVPPRTFSDLEFRHLTMPTRLLVGEQEFLFDPVAAVDRARRVLPNGDAELLSECNHAVVSDQTEQVLERLLEFFE